MSLCIACRMRETEGGLQCNVCLSEPRTSASLLQEAVSVERRTPAQLLNAKESGKNAITIRAPALESFHVTLPWSALASDNRNVGVTGRSEDRQQFQNAKARARLLLREAYGDREPSAGPVIITASLYVPDERVRDAPNATKGLLDAAKGILITDDRWQVLRWFKIGVAGVDCDQPRCELDMEPWQPNA